MPASLGFLMVRLTYSTCYQSSTVPATLAISSTNSPILYAIYVLTSQQKPPPKTIYIQLNVRHVRN